MKRFVVVGVVLVLFSLATEATGSDPQGTGRLSPIAKVLAGDKQFREDVFNRLKQSDDRNRFVVHNTSELVDARRLLSLDGHSKHPRDVAGNCSLKALLCYEDVGHFDTPSIVCDSIGLLLAEPAELQACQPVFNSFTTVELLQFPIDVLIREARRQSILSLVQHVTILRVSLLGTTGDASFALNALFADPAYFTNVVWLEIQSSVDIEIAASHQVFSHVNHLLIEALTETTRPLRCSLDLEALPRLQLLVVFSFTVSVQNSFPVPSQLVHLSFFYVTLEDPTLAFVEPLSGLVRFTMGKTKLQCLSSTFLHNSASTLRNVIVMLTTLPSQCLRWVSGLHGLASLNLIGNGLTTLPPMANLTSLFALDIQDNELDTLAPTNGYQVALPNSLQTLSVNGNKLTSLPSSVVKQCSLTVLYAAGNKLSHLSDDSLIAKCPNLAQVDVSANTIRSVSSNLFQKHINLTEVRFGNNDITQLPDKLFDYSMNFKTLIVNNNLMRKLGKLPSSVQELDVASNRLTSFSLPSHQCSFTHLVLDSNKLSEFPTAVLQQCAKLALLSISNNRLRSLPSSAVVGVSVHESLVELNLARNTLRRGQQHFLAKNVANLFPSLWHLDVSYNPDFEVLVDGLFPPQLSRLNLANVRSASVPTEGMFTSLGIGWSTLTEAEALQTICDRVVMQDGHLTVSHTRLSTLSIACSNQSATLELLDLSFNKHLKTLSLDAGAINRVRLSECTRLEQLTASDQLQVKELDISETLLPFDASLCVRLGTVLFRAQNTYRLLDKTALQALLQQCLPQPSMVMLDLRGSIVSNVIGIEATTNDRAFVVFPDHMTQTEIFDRYHQSAISLARIPQLLIRDHSFSCDLSTIADTFAVNEVWSGAQDLTLNRLRLSCDCEKGFLLRKRWGNYLCVRDRRLLTLVLLIPVVILGLQHLRRWRRSYRKRLGVMQLENDALLLENDELLKLWEVDASQITRIEPIAEGQFGSVWRVKYKGAEFAMKVLKPIMIEMDQESIVEFGREVDFLKRTRHPNLVTFFGAGWDDSVPFVLVELVENGTLQSLLYNAESGHRFELDPTSKARLALDIARGLAYLHQRGIVHLDIKSTNVLVTEHMQAKIADFGTIHVFESTMHGTKRDESQAPSTSSSAIAGVGTFIYMSPEACGDGQAVSVETDVFSYGVMLWELCAQTRPDLFEVCRIEWKKGPVLSQRCDALLNGYILPVSDMQSMLFDDTKPAVSSTLCSLYQKCVQVSTAKRPAAYEIETSLTQLVKTLAQPTPTANYHSTVDSAV
eukprot:m.285314 g.285314  ORF g.285314 m.285314 type:complete len:1284 (+) comp15775_c1_seq2:34-3885(+)